MKNTIKFALAFSALTLVSGAPTLTAHADAAKKNASGLTDFKVFGRFMMDYTNASTDQAGVDFSKTRVRRARIGASGKYGDNLNFKFEINRSDSGDVTPTDAYVEWQPSKNFGKLRIGHFKTANSLDEQTSSKYTSTLERAALTDAFNLNRRLGVAWSKKNKQYTVFAGLYGENASADSNEEGYAFAARGTYSATLQDALTLHGGLSYRYTEKGETSGDIRYRQRPYSEASGRILSTGNIAESDNFIGVEGAALYNNFWGAAEYSQVSAQCSTCTNGDPSFTGGYLEGGVFFGGQRGYKGGKFNKPKVDNPITDGGKGAFSLVARYDTLDLADSGANGGSQNTVILGADWWPTPKVRMGVNFYESDNSLGLSTSGLDSAFASLVTATATDEKVSGLMFRAQFEF